MLNEQVSTVEVVGLAAIVHFCTLLASPISQSQVLGVNVSLPFILVAKRRVTTIDSERTGKALLRWSRRFARVL